LGVEGPVLDPAYKSFIGLYPIPERHGLTIGELAQLFNGHFGIGAKLRVIPVRGWSRDMLWSDTHLRWTPTSPNVPYAFTPLVYLATGLIDEGGVNNGVGTDRPFEYAGGYGFDAAAFARTLNARAVPGARFEPLDWVPQRGFWRARRSPACRSTSTTRTFSPMSAPRSSCLRPRARKGNCTSANRQLRSRLGHRHRAPRAAQRRVPDDIVASWESASARTARSARVPFVLGGLGAAQTRRIHGT